MRDTWNDRDMPVLDAALTLMDRPSGTTELREVVAATGLTDEDVLAAARALDGTYLRVHWIAGTTRSTVTAASAEARRIAGQWPTADALADRILEVTEAMLQADITDAERTRWQAIRDGALGAGRDVLVQLAAAAMTGQLPH